MACGTARPGRPPGPGRQGGQHPGRQQRRHTHHGTAGKPPRRPSRAGHECTIIGSRDCSAGAPPQRSRSCWLSSGVGPPPPVVDVAGPVAVSTRDATAQCRITHDPLDPLALGVLLIGPPSEASPVEPDQVGPGALQPVEVVGAYRAPEVQRDPVDGDGAGVGAGLDDLLQLLLGVREARQDGGDEDPARDAHGGQSPQGLDASVRWGSAGLGQLTTRTGRGPHREAHRDLRSARCRRQHVGSRRTSVDLVRMLNGLRALAERLDDPPGQVVLPLGVLVRVGVGAHGDAVASPLRGAQLGAQPLHRVDLDHDLALEVGSDLQAEVVMGRPGEAVDAGVAAPPVGVDGVPEGHLAVRGDVLMIVRAFTWRNSIPAYGPVPT